MLELPDRGARVRVQEVGQGPPILFVHGGGVGGASWAALAAELSDFRCLLLDRPGCGLSPWLGRRLDRFDDFNEFADQLVAQVLDAAGVETAHVIGTSLGGYFIFRGAAATPRRVQRLVGIGSIFGSPMEHIPLVMRVGSIEPLTKLTARMPANRQVVRAMLRQIGLKDAVKSGRISREFEDLFLASMRHTDTLINEVKTNPRIINMSGIAPEAIISDEVLAKIEAPTKLIWGEADPMAGADVAHRFAAKIANAQVELWSATGHAPWMDDAGRAATTIRDFLST